MQIKRKSSQTVYNIILVMLCICTLYPLLLCLGVSFTNEKEVLREGYKMIPKEFDLSGYKYVFSNPSQILNGYKTTVFYSVVATIGNLFFCSMMAYPLSRKNFRFRNGLNFFFYFTCLFNGGLVPGYILKTRYLHLDDTIWIYIIPGLVSAWTIFYIRTSFQELPEEMVESAVMDGASEWRILMRFMIPLSKPILATRALMSFLGHWNDWYTSMLYIRKKRELTSLQYLLQQILEDLELVKQGGNAAYFIDIKEIPGETARMAMMFVVAGPALVVFPFFQRYFVKGIVVGSVKG